jgi:ketosteroid isomerase-like protein
MSTVSDAPTPRESIAGLVHRYADAVVRRDQTQWASTWAPNAKWHLGPGRSVEGREAIVELWVKAMGGFAAVVQVVNNGEVHVDGDVATGRWYINEHFSRRDGVTGMLLAYYDDTYVNVDGHWLFASRSLVAQYQGPPDLSAPFLNRIDL